MADCANETTGPGHGSSAVGLRGLTDQALALATVDLLALPVAMPDATQSETQVEVPSQWADFF